MKLFSKHILAAIVPAAAGVLTLASCADSFLDREPEGYYITSEQLKEVSQKTTKALLGESQAITTGLIRWGAGGTSQQHDFGQKSVDIATDLMCGDMVFSRGCSYGWFRNDANLSNAYSSSERTQLMWYTYYRIVNAANIVLESIGSDETMPAGAEQKLYYASAKTTRAFAYLNLANFYSKSYATDKDKKVLPIYREPSAVYHAPETIADIFAFVLSDLDGAIEAYASAAEDGVYPEDITTPDVDVAYTLKAYASLQMGDYAEALEAAQSAINVSTKQILPAADLYYGFNTVNNDNWMWGIDITADNTGGLCTFWGMMDYFTYSYTAAGDFKAINSDLFNEIPATDARRKWFTRFGTNPTNLIPEWKFYTSASTSAMGDRAWEEDIHFMRIEEAYLIAAESACRLGQTSTAVTYLKAILDERDTEKAEAIGSMSQAELLEEIYFEWRVEMWGEGKGLLTFKRFQKSMTRPSNDPVIGPNLNLEAPISWQDDRFTFSIPDAELEANPLMKDADQ